MHGGRTAFVSPAGWNDGNDAFTPEYEFSLLGCAGRRGLSGRNSPDAKTHAGVLAVCASAYFFVRGALVAVFFFPPAGCFLAAVIFFPPLAGLRGALAAVFLSGVFFFSSGFFPEFFGGAGAASFFTTFSIEGSSIFDSAFSRIRPLYSGAGSSL